VSGHKLGLLPGRRHLLFFGGMIDARPRALGSALGQVGASARSSAAFPQFPLPSRHQAVVLTGLLLPVSTQLFFRHDFHLSWRWIGVDALLLIYARLGIQLVALGFVGPRICRFGSSQAALSFLSRQDGEFHRAP
jgi:hypothetical protein